MSDVAIRVENLGKSYQIAHATHSGYKTLQEDLIRVLRRPFDRSASNRETFWALKDISFEVNDGEVLGIIGRNGAGKSTLLKILSRITKPTTGSADVYGRVGSLLEVGTGFHPELTGRENVFLNGAILGMSRHEIQRRFDEIVAFAEVEQFLDVPVKRYSSGMYMRLAFAVAAHLDPEILIVDEVLAVGDAKFQEKCLGKMSDVAHSGRTVLFVSHNMAAVETLCTSCLHLVDGGVHNQGRTEKVVQQYLLQETESSTNYQDLRKHRNRTPDSLPILTDMWLRDEIDQASSNKNRTFEITIRLDPPSPLNNPAVGLTVEDVRGQRIFSTGNYFEGVDLPPITSPTLVKCVIPQLPLLPGVYLLNIAAGVVSHTMMDSIYRAFAFTVQASGDELEMRMANGSFGALRVHSTWQTVQEQLS